MKIINFDLLSNPGEFEVFLLPISVYQKKNGTIPVMKGGFLEKIVSKAPNLPSDIGKSIEKYGNCPAVLHHIPGTRYPTKFITFPVSPTALRAENPDQHVFHRLKGRFKKFSLLPGWTLLPRVDMVEFSCIKLREIIKYHKLTKIAFPFEMLTFEKEDRHIFNHLGEIIEKVIPSGFFVLENKEEKIESYNTVIESNVKKE